MKHKIIKTVLVMVGLLLPCYAFSGSLISNISDSRTKSISLGVSYKLSAPFFNHFLIGETDIVANENIQGKKRVLGLKNDILVSADKAIKGLYNFDFLEDYVPEYANSLFGLSLLFGYSFENLRVELEGFYEKFDVKNTKSHVALLRRDVPDSDYVTLVNNGIKFYSVIVNICYDFTVNDVYFTPFLCVGAGEDIINIFSSVRFKSAFHTKVGFNYMVSKSVFLFMDVYYHRVIGNQYNNIPVQYPRPLVSEPTSTSAFVKLDMGYFGSEFGIRIFI